MRHAGSFKPVLEQRTWQGKRRGGAGQRRHAAFANCRALWTVHIPSSVQFIAEDAFEGCPNFSFWTESHDTYAARFADEHDIVYFVYSEMEDSNG